jgi:hypothetical protein
MMITMMGQLCRIIKLLSDEEMDIAAAVYRERYKESLDWEKLKLDADRCWTFAQIMADVLFPAPDGYPF